MQDMAKSRPINMKGQKGFKMLVLNETDRLSAQAQHSLRRTMEKYSASCRLVLCCNNVSKVSSSHPLPLQHCTLMLASQTGVAGTQQPVLHCSFLMNFDVQQSLALS